MGNNHSQRFYKIFALKNFAKFTGKNLCWSLVLTTKLKKKRFYRTLQVTSYVNDMKLFKVNNKTTRAT